MEYRISILLSDTPTYTKDVYENISDAEKALNRIDEDERMNYGIAQILSEDEIIEQEKRIQEQDIIVSVKWLNSESWIIEINWKTYYPEN